MTETEALDALKAAAMAFDEARAQYLAIGSGAAEQPARLHASGVLMRRENDVLDAAYDYARTLKDTTHG